MSTSAHVIDEIIKDHKEIQTYYEQYLANTDNPSEQQKWANQFQWEVARHSIGEELVLYPAFEKFLGANGKAMADKDRKEHQAVKDDLYSLKDHKVGTQEFDAIMAKLIRELRQHMNEEETQDLPRFRAAISAAEGEKLGKEFMMTKKFVPTRSHPSAPDQPPFETVVGLLTAPMDKLKDMFKKFPSEAELKAVEP
ncbi:HHE domain-containing protein [Gaertneriomyces semiglobifer]|nr:HHE domain-containing protein [Gaertneriomyces semiglobifer]